MSPNYTRTDDLLIPRILGSSTTASLLSYERRIQPSKSVTMYMACFVCRICFPIPLGANAAPPAFQEYSVMPDVSQIGSFMVLKNEEKLPWSAYLGMAGMPGRPHPYAACALLTTRFRSNCLHWLDGVCQTAEGRRGVR